MLSKGTEIERDDAFTFHEQKRKRDSVFKDEKKKDDRKFRGE